VFHLRCLIFCLVALALPVAAQEQTAVEFFPDLDTGGHRAAIRGLAISADGATLVTASDDKTVRVWDWQSGESRTILRGQIGPGNEGLVNALALSPDGTQVAVGGYFGAHLATEPPFGDIRIFDTRSGRILRVLAGHALVVDTLAYDPIRDELAASGQGGLVHRWQAPFSSAPQELPVLDTGARRVSHVAYAADGGRLIATTFDYGLRIWDMASAAEVPVPGAEALWDTPLTGLAVSQDGRRFALSGEDGRVELREAAGGAVLATLPAQPFRPDALAFALDDTALVVGCSYRCGADHRTQVWDIETQSVIAAHRGHDGGILVASALPRGARVASAGGRGNSVRIWDASSGAGIQALTGLGQPVSAIGIAVDGSAIAWGSADPCPDLPICPATLGPLVHALDLPTDARSFEAPRPVDPAMQFQRAQIAAAEVSVTFQQAGGFAAGQLTVTGPGGQTQIRKGPTDGYYHSAFSVLDDGILSGGGNGILLAHAQSDGVVVGEFVGHTGDVLALAHAAGRLVSGSADQTIKIWNLETRGLIATLFFAGDDWIIWTPQGYFHASPNGDRLIGWHINQGQNAEARFVRARQLRQHLHSPEIVRRAILTGDAATAASELRGTDSELADLLTRRPPEFDIRLADELPAPVGFAAVEITGASLEEIEGWGYSVLVNDRRVPPLQMPDTSDQGRLIYLVPVTTGENAITVSGANDFGYVTERSATKIARAAPAPKQGKLFVAVVGVNDYPNLPNGCNGQSCDLAYPVADAVEFLRVVAERSAPLFQSMEALVLVSPDALAAQPLRREALARIVDLDDVMTPDAATITDELLDFLARPGPDDTTIIFVAGHGVNVGERYFFIPENGQKRDDRWRMSSLVNWQIIQEEIGYATGRRILILDTCRAANAFNARLEKDAADARVVVLSATAANNTAGERPDLGHGIFTYALLEGLRGRADTSGDGVRLLNLADYVYREVLRLSNRKQEPFYHFSQTANFLLAAP